MNGRSLAGVILVLVLAAIVGVTGYQLGIAQGVAQAVPVPAGGAPVAYYGPHYWGFGFFPLGFLFPILFFFLFFALLRGIFWGGPWGRGRYWHGDHDHDVPGRFEEWHRRSHEQGSTHDRTGGPTSPQ